MNELLTQFSYVLCQMKRGSITNSDPLGNTVLLTDSKPLDLRLYCLHPAELRNSSIIDFHAICTCSTKLRRLFMPFAYLVKGQQFQYVVGGYNLQDLAQEAS